MNFTKNDSDPLQDSILFTFFESGRKVSTQRRGRVFWKLYFHLTWSIKERPVLGVVIDGRRLHLKWGEWALTLKWGSPVDVWDAGFTWKFRY